MNCLPLREYGLVRPAHKTKNIFCACAITLKPSSTSFQLRFYSSAPGSTANRGCEQQGHYLYDLKNAVTCFRYSLTACENWLPDCTEQCASAEPKESSMFDLRLTPTLSSGVWGCTPTFQRNLLPSYSCGFDCSLLPWLTHRPSKRKQYAPSKLRWMSTRLHRVTSQYSSIINAFTTVYHWSLPCDIKLYLYHAF